MKKEVVAHKDPKSPISEIFRTLRTNIQFINTNKKTKTLLITSTLPGEGKSWIASNLAVAFAQTGKKVVLVDADMRKGRQYNIFDIPPTPGLSNYLSQVGISKKENISDEIVDCVRKTEVPNLYLMPAGTIPPNPSELLVSPKMIKLLEKFKTAFDIVIIDGTPCELVTDAVILSRIVDSTVVVTAHKVTKKDALERVIKSIQNVGGNLTGVVVNKLPISGKKYQKIYYYYGESSDSEKEEQKSKGQETTEVTTTKPIIDRTKDLEIEKTEDIETTSKEMNEKAIEMETGKEENIKPETKAKRGKAKKETKTKTEKMKNKKKVAETKKEEAKDMEQPTKGKTEKKEETEQPTKTKTEKEEKTEQPTKTKTEKVKKATKTKMKKKENVEKSTKIEKTKDKEKTIKKETEDKEKEAKVDAENTKSEEMKRNRTEDILKKMNEYLEQSKAKKMEEEGEKND